jgi:hypothetical protein
MDRFIIVQRTGFCTYFLYAWDGGEDRWLAHIDLAQQFTAKQARKIVKQINARYPLAPIPVHVQRL